MVCLPLVLQVQLLPLALKRCDQLLAFLLGHKHLLTVTLCLFLNLHLLHKVVFVLDLVFDFGQVARSLAVGFLL